jgi:hypothetical protein
LLSVDSGLGHHATALNVHPTHTSVVFVAEHVAVQHAALANVHRAKADEARTLGGQSVEPLPLGELITAAPTGGNLEVVKVQVEGVGGGAGDGPFVHLERRGNKDLRGFECTQQRMRF